MVEVEGERKLVASCIREAREGMVVTTNSNRAETARKMEALEPVEPDAYYMRLAPTFDTPIGPHDWLTRTVIVGRAERQADHSIFDYFAVL